MPPFIDPSILARLNAESLAMGNSLAGAFQTPLPPLTPPVVPPPSAMPMVPEASGFSGPANAGEFLGMSSDQISMLLGKVAEQFVQRQQQTRDRLRQRLANAPGVQSPAVSAPAFTIPQIDFKGLLPGGRG